MSVDNTPASPSVRLVSGRLSDHELAAVAVAVSALSVLSREEAHERDLASRSHSTPSAWNSAAHRFATSAAVRTSPGAGAWQFGHRL